MKKIGLFFILILGVKFNFAQVLSVKEQAEVIDKVLLYRLDNLLPQLMQDNKIDCWLIISREYNEDPIVKTFLPATWLSARRTTILVFYFNPNTQHLERWSLTRYNVDNLFKTAWDINSFPDQFIALKNLLLKINPKNIALNYSTDFALADGLHVTELNWLKDKLGVQLAEKFISAENLAVQWLETRTPLELEIYPTLIALTKKIIRKGFSREVITPGVTTKSDLEWWFRQEIKNVGLDTWFHPSIYIQRKDNLQFDHIKAFSKDDKEDQIIMAGDLLHVDFGISYLRLNSDIQEHAYLLMPDETQIPQELQQVMTLTNRLQDILTSEFTLGKTGNEILRSALLKAKSENIKATIYTHPLGSNGHAAGPTIGLWDQQQGVRGSGDYPLHNNTCYSIELNASHQLKIWGKEIKIMLEQNGCFTSAGFKYLLNRQTEIIPIK